MQVDANANADSHWQGQGASSLQLATGACDSRGRLRLCLSASLLLAACCRTVFCRTWHFRTFGVVVVVLYLSTSPCTCVSGGLSPCWASGECAKRTWNSVTMSVGVSGQERHRPSLTMFHFRIYKAASSCGQCRCGCGHICLFPFHRMFVLMHQPGSCFEWFCL